MAKDKKSFLLYADIVYTIEHLTNEEKGILFQHILDYVNDKNPVLKDRILLVAWKPIERQLKRDLQKYEDKKDERSKSGQLGNLKRYYPDLYKQVKDEEITLKQSLKIVEDRKASHSDTKLAVNVTGTVNDTVTDTDTDTDTATSKTKHNPVPFKIFKSTLKSIADQNKWKIEDEQVFELWEQLERAKWKSASGQKIGNWQSYLKPQLEEMKEIWKFRNDKEYRRRSLYGNLAR